MALKRITAEKKGAKLNHPKPFNNITTKHVIQGPKCNLVSPEVRFLWKDVITLLQNLYLWNEIKILYIYVMLLVLCMTNKNHAGCTVTTEDALVLWLYKLSRPILD